LWYYNSELNLISLYLENGLRKWEVSADIIHVFVGAGLLNSPSKARVQDLQIDTGILSWGDPTDSPRNIGK
jgi:hypothetical protein